ncbi:type II toxin-antitoxin system RelE/ParE family toxin [Phormidesmis priestleyi ULC007]|uniref:Type II toxin-antitoxin system RelE/ParE family toxin n=1 Tax=Phormidesmis priestleyi ULC007 TaxID=1920490 RepID=A0A2T1DK12_9CYAN|nr:type II toxin-antitoxin system RelE/ParE family toxin [Phormidesmis priestleyi]PSB20839.1 type II toxin-antitoxin system RelE/ParE family toxin [Phormidesmis priestleyi ULC007]PZO51794.1 MAG: type II toxin-antitoxin system RelE/ParE family toxin [Phormidesmis priestleyi]
MTPATFNSLAEQELVDAAAYYEEQKPGLGLEYLEEVERAVNFLIRYPNAGLEIRGSVRRLMLPKFPYSLLYRVLKNSQIRILAVAHHKRRPKYWSDRK